jgi:hypothetical protein
MALIYGLRIRIHVIIELIEDHSHDDGQNQQSEPPHEDGQNIVDWKSPHVSALESREDLEELGKMAKPQ